MQERVSPGLFGLAEPRISISGYRMNSISQSMDTRISRR
jgi:hypothetical protein